MCFSLSSLCCFASSDWVYCFSANTPPWTWALYSMRSNKTGLQNGWIKQSRQTFIVYKPPSAFKLKDLKESRPMLLNSLEVLLSTIPHARRANSISNSWAPRWPFRLSCRISFCVDSPVAILRQSLALMEGSKTSWMLKVLADYGNETVLTHPDTLYALTIGSWLSERDFWLNAHVAPAPADCTWPMSTLF